MQTSGGSDIAGLRIKMASASWISAYEDRRLGYPRLTIRQNSERLSTVWHRLPADSLTSPPLPVAVGPFMVELFTVGCLVRSPRLSAPVWSVARLTAPHVSTVERTRHNSKPMSPRDGIRQSFATPASFRTTQNQKRRFRRLMTEHVRLARIQFTYEKNKSRVVSSGHKFIAFPETALCAASGKRPTEAPPTLPSGSSHPRQGPVPLPHRIERWDWSDGCRAHKLSESYDRF